jgi:hypothetical protein
MPCLFSVHLHPVAYEVLKRIQDLLVLSPDNGYSTGLISINDQMFIYEAAAVLIISTGSQQDVCWLVLYVGKMVGMVFML